LITFKISNLAGEVLRQEEHRIGEKWEWYPVARKLLDNNLRPLEERVFSFEYEVLKKEKLTLTVEITKHRITKENAEWDGILEDYPRFIVVFEKKYQMNG